MAIDIDQYNSKMHEWLLAFQAHPKMQPPSPHLTIFFMYDFVRNTKNMLEKVDARKYRASDAAAASQIKEIVGRNGFASLLIRDTEGKLAAMTGGNPAAPEDFGQDIKNAASEVCAMGERF